MAELNDKQLKEATGGIDDWETLPKDTDMDAKPQDAGTYEMEYVTNNEKPMLGRTFEDKEVEEDIRLWPYNRRK